MTTTPDRSTLLSPHVDDDISGAERRLQNRRQRAEQRARERDGANQRRIAGRVAVAIVAVVVVGFALSYALPPIIASYNRPTPVPGAAAPPPGPGVQQAGFPGQTYPDLGRQHIKRTEPKPEYNSAPPTSGPHWDDWPKYGIYDRPIDEEHQIHHLEHGGVMVQYQCAGNCIDLVDQLERVVRRYRYKVILAPYNARSMSNRIALTAWTRLDAFDDFDEARIVEFIEFYRNKGPEAFPDSDADVK